MLSLNSISTYHLKLIIPVYAYSSFFFVILFKGGKFVGEKEIDALLIQPGDVLKVIPGAKVPADGVVVWGSSYVNESMVTGESAPALKEVNSLVIGGTVNLHGALHIEATSVGSNTVLSQIISLVETAQMSKAPIQKFADYVSIYISHVIFSNCLYFSITIHIQYLLIVYSSFVFFSLRSIDSLFLNLRLP